MAGESDLERTLAEAQRARACRVVAARNVPDAIAALGLIGPGDRLVACADDFEAAYRERFAAESLSFVAEPTPVSFQAAGGASRGRTFWLANSIGCRGLRVPDLRALAAAARGAGAILVVDDTVASHIGCRPLELGATLCLEALDRVAAGRLGDRAVAVAVARPESGRGRRRRVDPSAAALYSDLWGERGSSAEPPSSSDLDVLSAELPGFASRMQRHMDGARAIAGYLSAHPLVSDVRYPGLASHRDHRLVSTILQHGAGPAVDFELAASSAGELIERLPGDYRAAPAGGPHPRVSSLDGADGSWVRLFAGSGDPLLAVDDIESALRALSAR